MQKISRRQILRTGLGTAVGAMAGGALATLGGSGRAAAAEPLRFLQIGTGTPAGTYFPMGGLIATGISRPQGSRPCGHGGSCGVDGLVAVAPSSDGSVANVDAIERGELESCFSQADVAAWAYQGTQAFAGAWPHESLRVVSNLYPESVHLVVRRNAGIFRVEDLRGMRVSIGPEGSGTRIEALTILAAYGLGPDDLDLVDWQVGEAGDFLRNGHLDGFFFVTGAPAAAITQLAEESLITLLPLEGPPVEKLIAENPFLTPTRIVAGAYFNVPDTLTLAVNCHWLVSANLPNELVYEMTRTVWQDEVQAYLRNSHRLGGTVGLRHALDDVANPPLHDGAQRFYQENGFFSWLGNTG